MKNLLQRKTFRTHLNSKKPIYFLLALFLTTFLISCGDDGTAAKESITLNFKAEVNNQPIAFSTGRYTTEAGNEISIDRMKMYISSVKLVNSGEQSSFEEPDSYHLVSLNADSQTYSFEITDIPGDFAFNKIEFAIGVDTEENFSLDNTGDLDPANDMAWNWDTGYKFFLLEGNFYPKDESDTRGLIVHIGHDKNYRKFTIDLDGVSSIDGAANVNFTLNALAALNGPNAIDLTDNSTFKGQAASDVIADNYSANLFESFNTDLK